jgi:hypothetical protein
MPRRLHGRRGPPLGLGPFSYSFRPSPAGRCGAILIRGPEGAPPPAPGDLLTLAIDDERDAEFEVTETVDAGDGWWASCERKVRAPGEDGD